MDYLSDRLQERKHADSPDTIFRNVHFDNSTKTRSVSCRFRHMLAAHVNLVLH